MKQTYSLSHFLQLIFNKNHLRESKKQPINQYDEAKKAVNHPTLLSAQV